MEPIYLIYERGGIVMLPLFLCSLLVLIITVERLICLRRRQLLPKAAIARWKARFSGSNEEQISPNSNALMDQVLGSLRFPLPISRLEERFADLTRKIKNRLERGLALLSTLAGVSPLLGLLGTALGMIEVFSKLTSQGAPKMEALSQGISQSLVTTVTGLCIGIPALIAYNLIDRHIENLLLNLEDELNSLLDEFYPEMVEA